MFPFDDVNMVEFGFRGIDLRNISGEIFRYQPVKMYREKIERDIKVIKGINH